MTLYEVNLKREIEVKSLIRKFRFESKKGLFRESKNDQEGDILQFLRRNDE